jgi:hypothetical protein
MLNLWLEGVQGLQAQRIDFGDQPSTLQLRKSLEIIAEIQEENVTVKIQPKLVVRHPIIFYWTADIVND